MDKIKKYIYERKFLIIIFIITIFILTLPNMHKDLVMGDDYIYHIARIQSITDSIRNGVFPVKINSTLANGFGYASAMFYPDLFLYVPSFLMILFNADVIISYKIFIALFLSLTFLIFYKSIYHITENRYSAIFGTIFLMLSRSLYMSLYLRFALGEFLGFTFILPALVGMYDYFYKDFKSPQYLILGFIGLINTHLITGLIVLSVCLVLFFINIKTSIKNPKKLLKLVACTIIVLLASAYFWCPMIEQLRIQNLRLTIPWTNIGADDYSLFDYLSNEKFSIGLSIILSFPFVLYGLINNKFEKYGKKYLIVFIVLSIILVCPFTWEKFSKELNIIQFRWRLLGIITTVYALSLTLLFNNVTKDYDKTRTEKSLIVILSILMFLTINNYYFNDLINSRITKESLQKIINTSTLSLGGGSEYLPVEIKEVQKIYEMDPNKSYAGKSEIIGTKYPNSIYIFNKKNIEDEYITIPFTYYYGYVANIKTEKDDVYPLEVSKSEDGFVRLKISKDLEGEVRVWYNGTKIQKISLIISVATIILTLVVLGIKIIKNLKRIKNV